MRTVTEYFGFDSTLSVFEALICIRIAIMLLVLETEGVNLRPL